MQGHDEVIKMLVSEYGKFPASFMFSARKSRLMCLFVTALVSCFLNGDGHTRTEKNFDQGGNWTHDLRVTSPPLYRLSYKVRREQAVGTEDVKVTAMNMYKYKERLRFIQTLAV